MSASDQFAQATEDKIPAFDRQDLVKEGEIVTQCIEGIGMCLLGTMHDAHKTDDHIVQSVDPQLYQDAIDCAIGTRMMAIEDTDPVDPSFTPVMSRQETCETSPDKTWIMHLTDAIFIRHGLDAGGYIPGTEERIFDTDRRLRACEIPKAEEIIDDMRRLCNDFVQLGLERIADYLSYPEALTPELLTDVAHTALSEGRSVTSDIRKWFQPSHDSYLMQEHTAGNVPPEVRLSYN